MTKSIYYTAIYPPIHETREFEWKRGFGGSPTMESNFLFLLSTAASMRQPHRHAGINIATELAPPESQPIFLVYLSQIVIHWWMKCGCRNCFHYNYKIAGQYLTERYRSVPPLRSGLEYSENAGHSLSKPKTLD